MPRSAFLHFPPVLLLALAAPVPKGVEEAKLFYPTKVGDKWTYLFTEKGGNAKDKTSELVEMVTAVEDKDGVKVVTVGRFHDDGKVYTNRTRRVSDRGVWQTEGEGCEPFRTPWVHLKLPHKPGQAWEDDEHSKDTSLTAHGPEKVKVPAGEYDAIRVEKRKRGEPKSDPIQTDWYAPRVGIVQVRSGTLLIVMKEFTPGKG